MYSRIFWQVEAATAEREHSLLVKIFELQSRLVPSVYKMAITSSIIQKLNFENFPHVWRSNFSVSFHVFYLLLLYHDILIDI